MHTQRSKVSAEEDLTIPQRNKRSKTLQNEIQNSLPIPVDLIIDIFSRLPAKSIARCRCLSKRWTYMLHRPYFTELFLTRSHARPRLLFCCESNDEILFLSSTPQVHDNSSLIAVNHRMKFPCVRFSRFRSVCALFCFILRNRFGVVPVICNPSTGQYLHSLPKLITNKTRFVIDTFFGYDSIEKQYKVLCMTSFDGVSEEHQVLTLGTGKLSWKRIECCLPHYPLRTMICVNGVMYYLAELEIDSIEPIIVSFDFRTEKFRRINLVESVYSTLANYNGKLASLTSDSSRRVRGSSRSFEMHILQDPEKHEWSKHVYEFPPSWPNLVGQTILDFVGVTSTNEILLSPLYISDPFYVFYYNIESKTIRRVEIQGMDEFKLCNIHTSINYVEDVKLMEMSNTYNLRSSKSS